MRIEGDVIQYFPGGNTAYGFYSLWDSNINDLDKLIILKGGPGTGKSTLLAKIARTLCNKGVQTELLWCSSDPASLDGVVFRGIGLGIVDGTAPHTRDPKYPGVVDKIINLGDYWDEKKLLPHKEEIVRITNLNKDLFRQTYEKLAQAKKYYDMLEQLSTEGMDHDAVNQLAQTLIRDVLGHHPERDSGKEIHRFSGAITPEGYVDHHHELSSRAKVKYVVKCKADKVKSALNAQIAQAARSKGFDVEYYHCGLEPANIVHIYIPSLSLAFLDGEPSLRAPHDTTVQGNEVLDFSRLFSQAQPERNQSAIEETNRKYRETLDQAFAVLKECKLIHDDLEQYYIRAMDFPAVDRVTDALSDEVLSIL